VPLESWEVLTWTIDLHASFRRQNFCFLYIIAVLLNSIESCSKILTISCLSFPTHFSLHLMYLVSNSEVRAICRHEDLQAHAVCNLLVDKNPELVHIDPASTALSSRSLSPRRLGARLRHPLLRGSGKGDSLKACHLVPYIKGPSGLQLDLSYIKGDNCKGDNLDTRHHISDSLLVAERTPSTSYKKQALSSPQTFDRCRSSRRVRDPQPYRNNQRRRSPVPTNQTDKNSTSVVSSGEFCTGMCSFI
jgi:hypothetical protein